MFGFIWLIHVLFTVNVPAELPVSRLMHLLIANNGTLVFITKQDLGVTVERGGKLIIR